MREYQIKDKDQIVIGRFADKKDRDNAMGKYISYGFPCEEDV